MDEEFLAAGQSDETASSDMEETVIAGIDWEKEKDLLRTIDASVEVTDERIGSLNVADVEVYGTEYVEPPHGTRPVVVQSPDKAVCIDGENYVRNAQTQGKSQIECLVWYVNEISEPGLTLLKLRVRHRPNGAARYVETMRFAGDCMRNYGEAGGRIPFGSGGAHRGKFETAWIFTKDEFTTELPAKALYDALCADGFIAAKPLGGTEGQEGADDTAAPSRDDDMRQRMNDLVLIPSFLDIVAKKKPLTQLPKDLAEMEKRTAKYRSVADFKALNVDARYNIMKLNRLLIEWCYPELCPKRHVEKVEDLVTLIARELNKDRKTTLKILNNVRALDKDTLEFFITENAPKSFFEKVGTQRNELLRKIEADKDRFDVEEYAMQMISDNVLLAYRTWKEDPKGFVPDLHELTDEEYSMVCRVAEELFGELIAPGEEPNHAKNDAPPVVTLPGDKSIKTEGFDRLKVNERLRGVVDRLTACINEAPPVEELCAQLGEQTRALLRLGDDIRATLVDWKRGG